MLEKLLTELNTSSNQQLMRQRHQNWLLDGKIAALAGCLCFAASTVIAQAVIGADSHGLYAVGYFGEPFGTLSAQSREQFDKGFNLFVRRWTSDVAYARNAESCVSCHGVPMPGGSGMTDQADVAVSSSSTETTVIQRFQGSSEIQSHFERSTVRRTPPLFGIGLIEYSKERYSEGKPMPVFGAFSEVGSIQEFVERAFAVELGISTTKYCARANIYAAYPETCKPQISDEEVANVVFFVQNLAAPMRSRNLDYDLGRNLFRTFGCEDCHTRTLHTIKDGPVQIRSMSFDPYSDLRMHDLGSGKAVRTAPLWGLNSVGPPYLHDASADSISSAIKQHGGAADYSRQRFDSATDSEKTILLAFLKKL